MMWIVRGVQRLGGWRGWERVWVMVGGMGRGVCARGGPGLGWVGGGRLKGRGGYSEVRLRTIIWQLLRRRSR